MAGITRQGKFLEHYRRLNPEQKRAVDTIEGPVMVVAGPGTGKTQILTLRIANILRLTDIGPSGILALTFSQAGVQAMRKRLADIAGPVSYQVPIYTFHGFCNQVIKTYPEYFPRIIGSQTARLIDQVLIIERLLDHGRYRFLKPSGSHHYYLFDILSEIEKLKKENLTPTQVSALALVTENERQRGRNQELARLYKEYEKNLASQKLYDFADMLIEVVRELKSNQELRLELAERYQYILADEHQDANQVQNDLLGQLTSVDHQPNLFIVGDDKQAIFQFQGASLDNFYYFSKRYPSSRLITLTTNYRSPQTILDAAHGLGAKMAPADLGLPPKLKSESQSKHQLPKIQIREFSTTTKEITWLTETIGASLAGGAKPDQLALLYRDNKDAEAVARSLTVAGIPVVVESEINLFSDPVIKKLLVILEAINYFGDDAYLFRFFALDLWQLPPLLLYRKDFSGPRFAKLQSQLTNWYRFAAGHNFLDLFGLILEETNFVKQLLTKPEAVAELAKVRSFYEEIKNLIGDNGDFNLTDFINYLELCRRHHLPLKLKNDPHLSGVRLLTAHKAKGLEFDEVFIIGARDGHWGNRRSRAVFSFPSRGQDLTVDDDSERRLFYVALTRARRRVTITYARSGANNELYLPSQFIAEIDPKLIERVEMLAWEKQITLADLPLANQHFKFPLDEKAYLNRLFIERGLSVTGLNNYLACPLKYLFNNLLRLVRVQNKQLRYGTAIHRALADYFESYRKGGKVSRARLLESFNRFLKQETLNQTDQAELAKRGRQALAGYWQQYAKTWPKGIINEFKVRGVFIGPKIRLVGQIDKVELLSDGEATVIDYKTGKPKTRREILGLNKGADGNYFRQLLFYKLLLDNFARGKYQVTTGIIDFVEPDEKGKYHREEFVLGEAEGRDLITLVTQTAEEILNLSFLHKGCRKPDCDACELWQLMGRG